jgi:hypothetical protein
MALCGLALVVFAVVALSGPGRIDIDDGQARFEAGRSLVEHGDLAVRDPRVVWHRLPGRNGQDYTYYRFPQELIAAGCILVADATGPSSEGRRHFIFSLHGAVVAAALAALYATWFRRRGHNPTSAILWGAGGVFCTPNWYYATSTFDDAIGSLAVVAAVVLADVGRTGRWWFLALSAGCVGLALNCKPPLAAVLLPAMALADDTCRSSWTRVGRVVIFGSGLVIGYLAFIGYDELKFPPEVREIHDRIRAEQSHPIFAGNPVEALLDFTIGPSSGSLWYFPPIILCAAGIWNWLQSPKWLTAAAAVAMIVAVVGFCSLLAFYKGGVCWGPRYLTPVFAMTWLFAPSGVALLGKRPARLLLLAGVGVQVLALAVVPERLHLERRVPSGFFYVNPWLYLRPEIGHVFNRPREVFDASLAPPSPEFTPAPAPSFCLPVFDPPYYTGPIGIEGVRRYTLLNGFRPWLVTIPQLPSSDQPIDMGSTAGFFGLLATTGFGILIGLSCLQKSVRSEAI